MFKVLFFGFTVFLTSCGATVTFTVSLQGRLHRARGSPTVTSVACLVLGGEFKAASSYICVYLIT